MRDGQPSATALIVALSVVREGARHGLAADTCDLAAAALQRAGGPWRLLGWLARSAAGRLLLRVAELPSLPGLARHHCCRKAWLQRRLLAAPPTRDVVWLGVGFDALGRTLLRVQPRLRLLETDHPATLALRRALLGPAPGSTSAALRLPDAADALLRLCAARECTLVAEGLPMYLAPRPLLRLLRGLAALPMPPRLVFSALLPTSPHGRGFARPSRVVDRWLRGRGEPFRWRIAPTRLARLLATAGYSVAARSEDSFGEYVIDALAVRGGQQAQAD